MKPILSMASVSLLVCTSVLTFVVILGLSIGFALNWLVPSIDLGVATLCGLVSVAITGVFINEMANQSETPRAQEGLFDADDEVRFSEETFEGYADQLSEAVLMRVSTKEQWLRPPGSKPPGSKPRPKSRR
ncbi:MAG TPA: hypothetical protein DDZ51_06810 [Planctomycetaceae bacterium]|nr:hypothetical protein [Planctomycetaceae bacterium]